MVTQDSRSHEATPDLTVVVKLRSDAGNDRTVRVHVTLPASIPGAGYIFGTVENEDGKVLSDVSQSTGHRSCPDQVGLAHFSVGAPEDALLRISSSARGLGRPYALCFGLTRDDRLALVSIESADSSVLATEVEEPPDSDPDSVARDLTSGMRNRALELLTWLKCKSAEPDDRVRHCLKSPSVYAALRFLQDSEDVLLRDSAKGLLEILTESRFR